MPIYYFDFYDGDAFERDDFGIRLESIEEAADQAAALLPDIARDALPHGASRNYAVFARDETEAVVYRAALLFRGQRPGQPHTAADQLASETDELIMRSRATRAAVRQVSAQIQQNVRDFLAILQESLRVATEMKAEAARRH